MMLTWTKVIDFLVSLSLLYACGVTLLFDILFLMAYFSPTFRTGIDINHFGEANLEFIILIFIMTPLLLYSLHRTIRRNVPIWRSA